MISEASIENQKKVSVIIPVFNRAALLRDTLKELERQTYPILEVIVVDDASEDNPQNAVKEILGTKGRCIRLSKKTNAANARNIGALEARGDVLAFLDSDDRWTEEHLSRKVELLCSRRCSGIFGAFYLVTKDEKKACCQRSPEPDENFASYVTSLKGDARTSTFVIDREDFMAVKFDSLLEKHQDWDFAIRFSKRFLFDHDVIPTAIIDSSGTDRMSASPNLKATDRFMAKHLSEMSAQSSFDFYFMICKAIVINGVKENQLQRYRRRMILPKPISAKNLIKKMMVMAPFYHLLPVLLFLRRRLLVKQGHY